MWKTLKSLQKIFGFLNTISRKVLKSHGTCILDWWDTCDISLALEEGVCIVFVIPIPKRVSSRPGPAMPRATSMAGHSRICLRDCVSSRWRDSHGSVNVSWTDSLHSLSTKRYIFCFKSVLRLQSGWKCENHEILEPTTAAERKNCMQISFIFAREFACETKNANVTSKRTSHASKKMISCPKNDPLGMQTNSSDVTNHGFWVDDSPAMFHSFQIEEFVQFAGPF